MRDHSHGLRLAGAVTFVAALALIGTRTTSAAGPFLVENGVRSWTNGQAHFATPTIVHRSGSGFSHAYADTGDGTACSRGMPDAIDVFTNSGGAPMQVFNTTADECSSYFGSDTLAYVSGKTSDCLVLANVNEFHAPGDWESFTVSKSTGMIRSQVSTLSDTYSGGSGTPEDVVAFGTKVIGADATGNLLQLSVNPKSCKLGKPKVAAGGNLVYNVVIYGSGKSAMALAADFGSSSVDEYTLKPFKFVKSYPGATAGSTDGISTNGTSVATGSSTFNNSEVQGSLGVPPTWTVSSDPSGKDSATTGQDSNCLWAGEETKGVTGFYTSPGAPVFQGTASTGNGSPLVEDLSDVGGTYYQDDLLGGEIDASTIGGNCAIAPKAWATLSNSTGQSNGLVFH